MKILIVDDHSLVREGLKAILSRSDLSAEYVDAWDSVSVWDQIKNHPDLDFVLLDIQLPDCSGLQLLTRIVAHRPDLPVVMLSADHDSQTVTQALSLGASGFLPKTSLSNVLVSAIRLVLAGGVYVPPEALVKSTATQSVPAGQAGAPVTFESMRFTARQIEVFRLLLQGMSNKQICRKIDVSEATVKIHVRSILRGINVSSRAEAIAKAAQLGLQVSD